MNFEQQYLTVLKDILENGTDKETRGGIDQRSLYGVSFRHNLEQGFPLLTVRKISFKIVAHELLWILRGDTNIKFLQDNGVHIWDKFANEDGEVGPMYQWRNWHYDGKTIDQFENVISEVKENPNSKRLVVSSWNVGELDKMVLPPCPHIFQFMVERDRLHCHLTQRAGDMILGVPYDLCVYALLTHMVAQICDLKPGEIFYNIADCHIYHNGLDVAKVLLEQTPQEVPKLTVDPKVKDISDFKYEHFTLENYNPVTKVTTDVAVGPLWQTYFYKGYK